MNVRTPRSLDVGVCQEDGITNATNGASLGASLIGTAWGYGYHYGWTDGQKEYLKSQKRK